VPSVLFSGYTGILKKKSEGGLVENILHFAPCLTLSTIKSNHLLGNYDEGREKVRSLMITLSRDLPWSGKRANSWPVRPQVPDILLSIVGPEGNILYL